MKMNALQSPLIDHIRHLASAKEISSLAFKLESPVFSDQSPMHMGRAHRGFRGLMNVLCRLRDDGQIELTLDLIHDHLSLDRMIKLSQTPKIDDDNQELINYIRDLPEITDDQILGKAKISPNSYEMHLFYQECMKEKIDTLFHILTSQ